jgi:response regulator RpfG family c-di-GMP phosphodiesterase
MPNNPSNFTILVIDDSSTNVVLLQAVLTNKGYNIETALNVKEAYSVMGKKRPDLILLDLLMPKINGYEFLTDVKANSDFNEIPVVVVSALSDLESTQKALSLGAHSFIKKPVDIQKLVDLVESIL